MASDGIKNAEVKAGLFLTFSIGLLVAMLFIYGKSLRSWQDRRNLQVVFNNIGNLRADAMVRYNGLEVGRVREVRLLELDDEQLPFMPRLTERHLENLPLTEDEKLALRGVSDEQIDGEIRKRIRGRTMVRLTLDVMGEGESFHYRSDDRVRVSSTLMGEAVVSIISGTGAALTIDGEQYLVGVSGDMYTHLSKSLQQVKNILASMSEMVGGGDADSPMAQKLENFDKFSERIEGLAGSTAEKLPDVWDDFDGKLEIAGERMDGAQKSLSNIKPELLKAFNSAEKTLADLRTSFTQMADTGDKQVKEMRERALKELKTLQSVAKEGRERIPVLVNRAYEWTRSFSRQVDKVDRWMTQSDRSLTQGIESTRQTLQGMRATFDTLEERLWFLAHKPWAAFRPPAGAEGLEASSDYRRALMARHYRELRNELAMARKRFRVEDASDRARIARVDQIMAELDDYLKETSSDGKDKKRRRRR